MINVREQIDAANRLQEIYNKWLAEEYYTSEIPEAFDEVMNLLAVFIKED